MPSSRREDVVGDLNEVHSRRLAKGGPIRAWLVTSAEALAIGASFLIGRWRHRGSSAVWLTWPEIRLMVRMARKQPLLNLAALLALATGLGLSAAAFTLVQTTAFSRLPLPDGDRFVRVRVVTREGAAPASIGRDRFEALIRGNHAFRYLGAAADGSTNLVDGDGSIEALRGVVLSAGAFRVLPYRPALGRTFVAADGDAGAPPVTLLSEHVWKRRFGGDPTVVGRTVKLGGIEREVVGVMPEEAAFPNRPDVWIPLTPDDFARIGPGLLVFGVLAQGATAESATASAAAMSAGYESEHPETDRLRLDVRPFTELPDRAMVQLFLGALLTAVLAVLAVIAANVGNLVSARIAARRGELAVRTALGAARRNLVGQLFGEVLLLGVPAAFLAAWGLRELMARVSTWLGPDLPFWIDLLPGPLVWAFLGVVTLAACALAGGVPAWRATGGTPGDALREAGGRGGSIFGRGAALMSVLQVTFSVALLGGALLAVRGMTRYAGARSVTQASHILTAGMSLTRAMGPDSARAALQHVEEAVGRLPGVERAGFASAIPGVEAPVATVALDAEPGLDLPAPRLAPVARARPGFFETLGATPTSGRLFRSEDVADGARPVAVVNESFVRKFLQGRNPLGRRVRVLSATSPGAMPQWHEIVGVVPDLGLSVGDPQMEAGVYLPLTDPSWAYLVLAVHGDPTAVAGPLRRAVARVEPDLLLPLVETLDHAGSENAKALALFGGLLGALGGMALLLSLVSTYALVSFTVSRRVREVGIRLALGASRTQVLRSVAGRAAVHVAVGAALGAPLGALLVQTKRLFVFRVPSGEPWLLPLVALLMFAAGALASWVPATRALTVAPSEALRNE